MNETEANMELYELKLERNMLMQEREEGELTAVGYARLREIVTDIEDQERGYDSPPDDET